jgi:hypothetical protein
MEKLREGDLLDVRDSEMIWCVAQVMKILITREEVNLDIHYLGWNHIYDETIPIISPRVANLGFYTMRNNIPMYKFDKLQLNKGNNLAATLQLPKGDYLGFKKLKRYNQPNLETAEEYYQYENSKICD